MIMAGNGSRPRMGAKLSTTALPRLAQLDYKGLPSP